MASNISVLERLPWEKQENNTLLYNQVVSLLNTIYYLLLIPVATIGNILTVLVVIYIVKNEKRKRSVPDLCLGVLAVVDMLSVFFVHAITLGAMYRTEWTYPHWACLYQGYAASVYMKLEFVIQVLISLDRHFALVRPLKYHTFNSLVTFKIALTGAAMFAFGTTSLTFTLGSDRVTYIDTWQFCAPAAQFDTLPDIILNTIVSAVFVAGIIAFVVCNVSLVNILRHYHNQRATSLLRQISDAMEAMKREHGKTRNGDPRSHKRTAPKILYTQNSQSPDKGDKNLNQTMTVIENKNGPDRQNKTMDTINGDLGTDVMAGSSHGKCPSQSIPDQFKVETGPDRNACSELNLSPLCHNSIDSNGTSGTGIDSGGEHNKVTPQDQVFAPVKHTSPPLETERLLAKVDTKQAHRVSQIPQIRLECEVNSKTDDCDYDNQSDPAMIGNQSEYFDSVEQYLTHSAEISKEPQQITQSSCIPIYTEIKKSRSFTNSPGAHLEIANKLFKCASVGNAEGLNSSNKGSVRNAASTVSSSIFPGDLRDLDARSTDTEDVNSTEFSELDSMTPNKTSPNFNSTHNTGQSRDLAVTSRSTVNNQKSLNVSVNQMSNMAHQSKTSPQQPTSEIHSPPCHANISDTKNVHKAQERRKKPSISIHASSSTFQRQISNGLPKSRASKASTSSQRTNGYSKSHGSSLSPGSPPESPRVNGVLDPLAVSSFSSPTESWDPARAFYIQQQMAKFLKKMQKKARKQKRELLLAKLVVFCATVFVITWLPYITVTILSFCDVSVSMITRDVSLKLVFLNALLNPVFYGLCRKTYRKGFSYLVQLALHYVCCGSVERPGEDKVFFDSRKKKQKRHLEAAMFESNAVPKACHRQPALDRSAHALLLLQRTLSMRPVSPGVRSVKGQTEFKPSRRLHELYERYMLESDSSTSEDTSSVDYEALVFGDEELYHNLQKVWSLCFSADGDDLGNYVYDDPIEEVDSDIDLDIDYDALLGDNGEYVNVNTNNCDLESDQADEIYSNKTIYTLHNNDYADDKLQEVDLCTTNL